MNFEHMRRLCGWHFVVRGVATLPDFEFGFNLRGYNAIRQKTGSKVFGVLYNVDQECMDIMDEFEGYPKVFNRVELEVKDENNAPFKAWVYLEKAEEFGGTKANQPHLNMIIAGAVANHLPQDWIDFLGSFKKDPNN